MYYKYCNRKLCGILFKVFLGSWLLSNRHLSDARLNKCGKLVTGYQTDSHVGFYLYSTLLLSDVHTLQNCGDPSHRRSRTVSVAGWLAFSVQYLYYFYVDTKNKLCRKCCDAAWMEFVSVLHVN
jgi:hypothetical protein